MSDETEKAGFHQSHLTDKLFRDILQGIDPEAVLLSWSEIAIEAQDAFGTSLMSNRYKSRIIGFIAFLLKYRNKETSEIQEAKVVLKSKPTGQEFLNLVLPFISQETSNAWKNQLQQFGHPETHYKELKCINISTMQAVMPDIFWSWEDEENEIFVFAMEYIDECNFTHLNTINCKELWTKDDIITVLQGLAHVHANNYERMENIPSDAHKFIDDKMAQDPLQWMANWEALMEEVCDISATLKPTKTYNVLLALNRVYDQVFEIMKTSPKTIVHYDLSIKNLCLRKQASAGKQKLCMYDWEFAAKAPPQLDVAHFLGSLFDEKTSIKTWQYYLEVYLAALTAELRKEERDDEFAKHLSLSEFTKVTKVFDMCLIERLYFFLMCRICVQDKTWPDTCLYACLKYLKSVSGNYSFLRAAFVDYEIPRKEIAG